MFYSILSFLYFSQIPAEDFSKDPDLKQYVYLQAQFPGQVLEKVVLVSFQPGYIFIQTDKPIYTHDSTGESGTTSVLTNWNLGNSVSAVCDGHEVQSSRALQNINQ